VYAFVFSVVMFFKRMAYFNVSCHVMYITMMIHKYFISMEEHLKSINMLTTFPKVPRHSLACSNILIAYEPWNARGSHQ
jgi:hypothetical protein